jgi:hypothetical protein
MLVARPPCSTVPPPPLNPKPTSLLLGWVRSPASFSSQTKKCHNSAIGTNWARNVGGGLQSNRSGPGSRCSEQQTLETCWNADRHLARYETSPRVVHSSKPVMRRSLVRCDATLVGNLCPSERHTRTSVHRTRRDGDGPTNRYWATLEVAHLTHNFEPRPF